MPKPLSDIERRVLDYLVEYLRENTYQPSVREIGRRFDIKSTKTVSELLQTLADKGWIERDPSRSRGVRLLGLDMRPETVTVPWYEAPGGTTARPASRVLGAFELDRQIAGASGTFMFAMRDDHLTRDGIRKGDLLLVEPLRDAELDDGDLVLAQIDGSPIAARLARRDGHTLLQMDPDGPTVRVRGGVPEVLGRVTGIVRRLRVPTPIDRAASARQEV